MLMRWMLCGLAVLGTCLSEARAWSNKEHIQLTRIAAARLIADPQTPPPMKQWLQRAVVRLLDAEGENDYFLRQRVGVIPRGADGLSFWAAYPDMMALIDKTQRTIEPFGVSEGKLHYIDVEHFMPDESKRAYADDLSHKPALADFPRDIADPRYQRSGVLPFTIEHYYSKMVKAIRENRLDDAPGQYPRDDHAARWAGSLAHFLEDNTQPQHGTEDYKSRSYFKVDPASAPDVHADMEHRLVDDEHNDYIDLRREMWPLFTRALEQVQDPVTTTDLWKATLEVSLISYDALPMIGRAAQAAYPQAGPLGPGPWNADAFFHFKGQYLGREMTVMEMKAHQYAWAVKRVQKTWRQAWDQALGDRKLPSVPLPQAGEGKAMGMQLR
jgi:hypothetical protein